MLQNTWRFTQMDRVIYGQPYAAALAEQVQRLGAQAVFVLASGTLARETDAVDQLRQVLGNRLAGVCAKIGAHTPRTDVVAAANAARDAKADLLVTIGGGSVTDAAKMVGLCLGNDVTDPAAARRLRRPHHARRQNRAAGQQARRRCARSTSPPRCPPASTPRSPAAPTRSARRRKATAIR